VGRETPGTMSRTHALLTVVVAMLMIPLSGCVSDGVNGVNGVDGAQGEQGPKGEDGVDGLDGVNGTDGFDGVNGTSGANGTNGANGTDGKTTLIQTFVDYPGEGCVNGGVGLHVGIDDDSDGYLSIDEVDETVYVCDGADGQDGADGTSGGSSNGEGSNGGATSGMMLSDSIRLSKSDGCPAGGRLMAFGLDNGDNGGTAVMACWRPVKSTTKRPTAVSNGSVSSSMLVQGQPASSPCLIKA